ncbi:MAG: WYL domain-containing protein [Chloroflexota bacterium]
MAKLTMRGCISSLITFAFVFSVSNALAQSSFEEPLCIAAKENRVIELIYEGDAAKGCIPRLVDVHQLARGKNGTLYFHGWQSRGCTKGRDYASKRIFRVDRVKSLKIIEGAFGEQSQSVKAVGWDGCLGNNCFIEENLCE